MADLHRLQAALAVVEPVELRGVALLQALRPAKGEMFPVSVDRADLAAATREMTKYVWASQVLARQLGELPPVPLDDSWEGYGL